MKEKKSVLFVCTGNAGRSQMAEALFRRVRGDCFNVGSAGVDPWNEIHPLARSLMVEKGCSMEGQFPKHVLSIDFSEIDVVVTIGSPAERGTSGIRGGKIHIHWNIDDPAGADGTSDSESVFRRTKERIERKIQLLVKKLSNIQRVDDFYWRPGISTGFFKDDSIGAKFSASEHIPILAEKGFELIELGAYIPDKGFPWWDERRVVELIKVCDDNGVKIWSAHPPENMILLGDDPQARYQNLDMLRRFADFCNRIGAAFMPIHFWSTTRTLEEVRGDSFMEFLLGELESISYDSNVTLCLETLRSNVSKVSNFELLEIVSAHSDLLGLLVDSGHSRISGDLNEIVRQAGGLLKSLHLHDNDGTKDLHQVPGSGVVDWSELVESLRFADYSGPIMYEVGFIPQAEHLNALDTIMENFKRFFRQPF
ncbi:MAG: TIM barrel protein [Victivallales bacterium]|nr:TIM barrel protein [Victivallales bacterium]